jgi:2'-phosphotransferase
VNVLLKHLSGKNTNSVKDLQNIANNDQKKRFNLVERNGIWFMRENQGHSIDIVIEELLTPITVPDVIHGTFKKNSSTIINQGLSRMKCNHIHFATSRDASSGIRNHSDIFCIC